MKTTSMRRTPILLSLFTWTALVGFGQDLPRQGAYANTQLSAAAGLIQYQDLATSPLVYSGFHVDFGFGKLYRNAKRDFEMQYGIGGGLLASNAPEQVLSASSAAYQINAKMDFAYMFSLLFNDSEKWRVNVGPKMDFMLQYRINPSLQNAAIGIDGFMNLMVATKVEYHWNTVSKKKAIERSKMVYARFNAGLLNFNVRPGYNYLSSKPVIGDLQVDDYQKDERSTAALTMNGYRYQAEVGMSISRKNSRSNQVAYVFDGIYAPGRFEPLGTMFHQIKYTLNLQKIKK